MKKLTTIFGIVSALTIIAAIIHKTFHWPFGDILLLAGIGVFLMIYLLLLCIQKIKESNGLEKGMFAMKYVTYMWLAISFLFLFMHWPGSIWMMDIGFVLYIVGYLTMKFMVQRAKHPESSALNKVLPSLIVVVMIFGLASRNMGTKIFDAISFNDIEINTMSKAMDTTVTHVMTEFELNKAQFPGQFAGRFMKAKKINQLGDSLIDFITTCKIEVTKLTNKEQDPTKVDLYVLTGRANVDVANGYFMTSTPEQIGKAFVLRKRIEEFNDSISKFIKADSTKEYSMPVVRGPYKSYIIGKEMDWEEFMFGKNMLINDLAYLDVLILNIKQTESKIAAYLLSEARAEAMWSFWKKYKELVPDKKTK